MQNCSYCGRENSDESTFCRECGTRLKDEAANVETCSKPAVNDPRKIRSDRLMLQGAFWFFGGMAVTVFTYSMASSSPYGGHYVFAFGPILFGIAQFLRGLAAAGRTDTDTNDQAQELLDEAARLEGENRPAAASLYAEIAKRFPGTRASDEAERNIRTLISYRK